MADDKDSSQKTEEPTPKKLEEARKKGQIASSREVNHWFMILAAAIVLVGLSPTFMRKMTRAMSQFVQAPDTIAVDERGLGEALATLLGDIGMAAVPMVAIFLIAALGAGALQSGFLIAVDRIQPKLEKISLFKGVKRLFSLKGLVEFLKGLVKVTIVGAVAAGLLLPEFDSIDSLVSLDAMGVMDRLHGLARRLLIGVLSVMTLIALLDYGYQKYEFRKEMRMSHKDIKDEMKQTEGDPLVRSRLRQIRMERARRRMMAAVPEADVVIVNPEHYAVALSYKHDEMSAPRVVAKGVDHMAQRIREVAEEHDVSIVENPPLARGLYAVAEVDEEIPAEHYKAVAEIIGYVMRLKGHMMAE